MSVLKCCTPFIIIGNEADFEFDIKHVKKVGSDFKNDLCNGMVKYYPDHIEDEGRSCRALFLLKRL